MLSLNFERFPNSTVSAMQFPPERAMKLPGSVTGRTIEADVYRRVGRGSHGVIIVLHGMTVTGNRDPRVINLCRALAEAGFTAVAPLIPEIQDQQLRPETYEAVSACIQRITENSDLCPRKKAALLGPSFSGSAGLIAAARPENINRITSICTIGSYAGINSTFDFFFRSNDVDEYGKTIVLWNYLEYAVGKNKAVQEALKLATLDNGHRRGPDTAELPAYLEKMKPKDRELFERLRNDGAYRLELWETKISAHPSLQESKAMMECAANLVPGLAPVTLIHGRADDVIPASESELLYARLNELGVPARLCITDLISHGDHGLTLGMLPQAVGLAGAFAYFFRHA